MSVLIETTIGCFVVDLLVDERPNTSRNFLKLCKMKYYNFCSFHSIESNFIAQTGDPTRTGKGGESFYTYLYGPQARYFERENTPEIKHRISGLVSMVNNGDNGHGSQFFITLADNLSYLDATHTVFGSISENSEEIVQKLNESVCDNHNRPYIDILITHTIVLDDPFPDDVTIKYPKRSPSPSVELLNTMRIGADEDLNDGVCETAEEEKEKLESKEALARAHVLEMIGDIHHVDEKPPDNVLFVCKLNAVTTDEDLEIIFSRFGKIKSCEIIRDKKTENSLQYAFIEFERPEDCETAYFKMDNVLIDDRRIHVDFSQSVAKNYQWKKQVVGKDSERSKNEVSNPPRHRDEQKRSLNKQSIEIKTRDGSKSNHDKSHDRDKERRQRYHYDDKHHDDHSRHLRQQHHHHHRRRRSKSRSKSPHKKFDDHRRTKRRSTSRDRKRRR